MSEEHAAADLLFFQPEDAPQILELIPRYGIEGLYQLLEDFSRIAEDICQRTIAIGLVNPGIDFIVFPQFWRRGAVKSLVPDAEAPGSAEPTGGASQLSEPRYP
jgi:hypothetical protein